MLRKNRPYGFVPPAGASILLVPLLGKLVACAEKNARTASYPVLNKIAGGVVKSMILI